MKKKEIIHFMLERYETPNTYIEDKYLIMPLINQISLLSEICITVA